MKVKTYIKTRNPAPLSPTLHDRLSELAGALIKLGALSRGSAVTMHQILSLVKRHRATIHRHINDYPGFVSVPSGVAHRYYFEQTEIFSYCAPGELYPRNLFLLFDETAPALPDGAGSVVSRDVALAVLGEDVLKLMAKHLEEVDFDEYREFITSQGGLHGISPEELTHGFYRHLFALQDHLKGQNNDQH